MYLWSIILKLVLNCNSVFWNIIDVALILKHRIGFELLNACQVLSCLVNITNSLCVVDFGMEWEWNCTIFQIFQENPENSGVDGEEMECDSELLRPSSTSSTASIFRSAFLQFCSNCTNESEKFHTAQDSAIWGQQVTYGSNWFFPSVILRRNKLNVLVFIAQAWNSARWDGK